MYTPDPNDKEGKVCIKKKVVVTEGGAFPKEVLFVIRKLRALNNVFASSRSPERIAKLKEVQTFYKFPQLAAMVDIDVRVASTVKLFRRSIVNYPAFNAFFQRADLTKSEKAVFTSITMAEWELVVQLEAVVQRIADLALVESQSATMLSSTIHEREIFCPSSDHTAGFKCFVAKMYQADITSNSIPTSTARGANGYGPVTGPTNETGCKNYLQIPDWAQAATGHILEDTKALLRAEHRVMYKALHINEGAEGDAVNSAASSPGRDCSSSSGTELDLLCGEEVLEPVDSTPTDVSLNAKADAVMEQWLDFRIDWEEVVRHQIPDKQECDRVLSKLTIRNKKQGSVRV
ncbi:hypothetical protein V7S43_008284 [Phytophthora oleae]|uniref:Uncharacterized protein n=1 Tax=Phytophthora oleae TaxID=2107226 RepID=A0ABD3FM52_9STRA